MSFYMPVKVIAGKNCVRENAKEFRLGKCALIVASPSSERNGALSDVLSALEMEGIPAEMFTGVVPNPPVELVDGLMQGLSRRCDFVIGIGGGSAMDTAKAAAVLLTNEQMGAADLFCNAFEHKPAPMVLIPTTAGTGSETTQWSILTVGGGENKQSFGNADTFGEVAMLDASYMLNIPKQIMRDTAVDALCHAAEAYVQPGCGPMSGVLCREALRLFGERYDDLKSDAALGFGELEQLLLMATYAGAAIAQEKTAAPHAMGYAITCRKGVAHGAATGVLLGAYLEAMEPYCADRVSDMIGMLGLDNARDIAPYVKALLGIDAAFTQEDIAAMTRSNAAAAIARNNPRVMDEALVTEIYRKALLA